MACAPRDAGIQPVVAWLLAMLRPTYLSILMLLACSASVSAMAQAAGAAPADPCSKGTFLSPGEDALEQAAPRDDAKLATDVTTHAAEAVADERFPELAKVQWRVRTFRSDSDYFRTRFSLGRFFFFRKMRYFVDVNPRLLALDPPPQGVCAILGHELSHVADMSRGKRIRLLGLVRLISAGFTAKFERRTDLQAIQRGFGPGLKDYRAWIYRNIPPTAVPRKERNYFSPTEIDDLLTRLRQQPDRMQYWLQHVPRNDAEIRATP
jgi:hypothetical protein